MERIPSEILQAIFKAGQDDIGVIFDEYDRERCEVLIEWAESVPDFRSMHTRTPRMDLRYVLPQVCRHWHDVALGMPDLWTSISLTETSERTLENMTLCLQRSGDLPLDVWLNMTIFIPDEAMLQERIFRVLSSHLSRVRVLALILESSLQLALSMLFPAQQHFELCHLEKLYCFYGERWMSVPARPIKLATLRAPKIKSFMVHPDAAELIRTFVPPSLEKLAVMGIGLKKPATEDDLRIISQCHGLHTLYCGYDGRPLPNKLAFDFNFHHLRSLSILLMTERSCSVISQHFHTPVLEQCHLKMFGDEERSQSSYGQFVWVGPFLRRNSQLKRLLIQGFEAYDDATDVFTQFTNLTTLKIFNCDVSDPFIATFLAEVDARPMLPNLRLFEFSTQYIQDGFSKLVEVAKSRLTDDEATCATIILCMPLSTGWGCVWGGSEYVWNDPDMDELDMLEEKFPRHCTLINV